jgi:Zn-finger nucleic acid-binding protein
MRVYERSGVTIDQCTECRGIFLDRGELEKLFEAESNWNSRQAPAHQGPQPGAYTPPPPPPAHGSGYGAPAPAYGSPASAYGQPTHGYPGTNPQQYGYHGHYRHHGHYAKPGQHGHYRKRRRKGFLNELFD